MKQKLLESALDLTTISSKGQLVIPNTIRKELSIKEGDVFATACAENDLIILKKIRNPIMKEDLMILKEVGEAWKEIEQGRSKTLRKEEFLEELKKW